jgi:signal transduction histidine kinase
LRKRNIARKTRPDRSDAQSMNPPDRDRPRRPSGAAAARPTGGPGSAIAAALGQPSADNAPIAADHATDRYAVVAHEMANLLDGSLRWLALAKNRLGGDPALPTQTGVGEQLGHVSEALARMSDLVEALMRPGAGQMAALFGSPRTMLEAVEHSVAVVRPLAEERKVTIALRAEPSLAQVAAGPLFTVISNGLRNAVEASGPGSNIEVHARLYPSDRAFADIGIDILDEGCAYPAVFGDCVFDFGFTTKEHGSGVGLALARDIVQELGGSISLTPRGEAGKPGGAHLRIRVAASPLGNS